MTNLIIALHLLWAYSLIDLEVLEEYVYYIVTNMLGGIFKVEL